MNKNHYIYSIVNQINDKFYIGRRSTDKSPLEDDYFGSGGKHFKNALKKYGKENFVKEIIEFCPDFETLKEREIYWINLLQSYKEDIGYNKIRVSEGWGVGELNPVYGDPTKNPMYGKRGENSPHYGKSRPDWVKDKIRQKQIGKIVPEDVCKKMSIAASQKTGDKNPFFGKTHKEESKQKIRESQSKRPLLTCPYCGLQSKSDANMKRYHFENCLQNPNIDLNKVTKNRKRKSNNISCPYCNKNGAVNLMKRYHFDNCKYKE